MYTLDYRIGSSRPNGNRGNRGGSRRSSSSPRPSSGGGRGGSSRKRKSFFDLSMFVNKAVITEEVEHFVPDHQFADFAFDEKLKKNVAAAGYVLPTPIQDRTIPHILQGQDVVGIANTGTGKTAAFLLPLITKTLRDTSKKTLIMCPTRELAIQIEAELMKFSRMLGIFSVCVVGGAPMGRQIASLRRAHHFVIGTPGRLKDLVGRRALSLANVNSIVLDEADRMLDMGFIGDMRELMALTPKEGRQTLFFSATLSPEIDRLINDFLNEPVRISVKTGDTSKNIDQDIVRITPEKSKVDVLHDLLIDPEFKKVLIFGQTKHGVERLSQELLARGFKAESIHGDKNHARRQRALSLFKGDNLQVLVATDVAARGLDIADVSHVINYELPQSREDYVHRIGRTGRGSKKGKALTFIDHDHPVAASQSERPRAPRGGNGGFARRRFR